MPLISLINLSIKTNVLADLKISKKVPVPKINNFTTPSNLRPINLLSSIKNILEKVIYSQLIDFIEENNLINSVQSGFKAKRSCETAIQCVLDDWETSKYTKLT